jgi:S-formylglutathione hydrolase FrmB
MKTALRIAAVSIGLLPCWPTARAQSPTGNGEGDGAEASTAQEGEEASPSRMEYFELESKVLKLKLNVGVYVPPGYDGSEERYPSLYFLHGLWGNARKWEERHTDARLDELIEEGKVGPMLVVCPDGMNSMYVNAIDGKGDWCDFLATELVETIDAKYRTKVDRASRGVNGDSMGGYGALNLVLKHPDVFASVSAHSAAVYPVDPKRLPDRIQQFAANWKPVYDWPINEDHWKEWNPLALVETLPEESLKQVAIYFDCGDRDRYGFDQTNAQMHEILEKRGIPHTWHLRSGGHGADYFSTYVGEAFQFHGELFDAAATAGAKKSEEPAR